jgi:hypothetical protein
VEHLVATAQPQALQLLLVALVAEVLLLTHLLMQAMPVRELADKDMLAALVATLLCTVAEAEAELLLLEAVESAYPTLLLAALVSTGNH